MHIALKVGKPWGTNFTSPPLLDTFLHNNPQNHATQLVLLSLDIIPFQFYTTLRIVNNFSVTCKGICVIQGLLLLGSTLDMSTLDSTTWSTQVSEYPREYLST